VWNTQTRRTCLQLIEGNLLRCIKLAMCFFFIHVNGLKNCFVLPFENMQI
jgi:hypothetical protein